MSTAQLLRINGQEVPSSTGDTFSVCNPMSGSLLYESAAATISDYERAIESAHAAFASWSQSTPSTRRNVFLKAADIIESYVHSGAIELMAKEISANRYWAVTNVKGTVNVLREAASLATHLRGEVVPTEKQDVTAFIERRPVGVVFGISPWNAPMILTARALATPLICGNTVVIKPSELSPKSQALVVQALQEAGLPSGCVQFLPTAPKDTPAATEYAIRHRHVRRVNFTGSDRVGRIIAQTAGEKLKQCVFELGGKAPLIILHDADIDKAVQAVTYGAFTFNGQVCMSTERVLVDRSVGDTFRSRLSKQVEKYKCGDPSDETASITSLYSPASARRVVKLIQDAIDKGAQLIAGDAKLRGPRETMLSPVVLDKVTPEMSLFHEESFGPVVGITEFSSIEEAVRLANTSEYTMMASVFGKDTMQALRVARQVRAGACHVNSPTIYIESTLPNGGLGGGSGYGRFAGAGGVEEYTERRIVTMCE